MDEGLIRSLVGEIQEGSTTAAGAQNLTKRNYNKILQELHEMSGGDPPSNFTCPPPLVLFRNKLVRQSDSDAKPIPRILHVSHKNRCIAPDLKENLDAWGRALPRFSIFFYDDEAVEKLFWHPLVTTTFPHLNHIRKCAIYKSAMKVDIWRILVAFVYGGLYSDIDNNPSTHWTEVRWQ